MFKLLQNFFKVASELLQIYSELTPDLLQFYVQKYSCDFKVLLQNYPKVTPSYLIFTPNLQRIHF